TFVLAEEPANVLENWVELVTTSDVQSVNGKTGNVTLTKSDVGLSNVNNTADADKPVATQSVNGLLSAEDKKKLDNATSNATGSRVAMRDSAGKSKFKGVTIESAPSANTDATTKAYVDAQVSSLAGGSVLSNTDWDAMRTTASTGVVEGFVKGCPAGGKVSGASSEGFVSDPVWRLEVRPEGLDYVTLRATLLNCTPKFMVGFIWERIYNPATVKWSKWTCVGGDTGGIVSFAASSTASGLAESPFRHKDNGKTSLYGSAPLMVRRSGDVVHASGAMTTSDPNITESSQITGVDLAWFVVASQAPTDNPGADWTLLPLDRFREDNFPAQQGSSKNTWFMSWSGSAPSVSAGKNALIACRWGPGDPGSKPWLNFRITWPAAQINTYTGPGFVPPVLDSHWGTSPI